MGAGIKYLKILTGVGENASNKILLWKVQPKHGLEDWQVGRVNLPKYEEDYRIVVTTSRSDKSTGYVAIDDFEFTVGGEPCSLEPAVADPTTTTTTSTTTTTTTPTTTPTTTFTTTTTTTTNVPGGLMNCNFQDTELCGWIIDDFTNATGRFHFERKNGDENLLIAALPDTDHAGSRTGMMQV